MLSTHQTQLVSVYPKIDLLDSDESQSDAEHDYEEPCDSPPPIPSRQPRRTGSYDVQTGTYDVTSPNNDDDSDDDDDSDNDPDYVMVR